MHIPVSFFEGVMIYKNHANNMFNRRKFKKITTANHFDHNDLFKLFCIYQKRGSSTIGIVGRDGGETAQLADVCVIIPTESETLVTPLAESFQSLIWHLLVSHPQIQVAETKW